MFSPLCFCAYIRPLNIFEVNTSTIATRCRLFISESQNPGFGIAPCPWGFISFFEYIPIHGRRFDGCLWTSSLASVLDLRKSLIQISRSIIIIRYRLLVFESSKKERGQLMVLVSACKHLRAVWIYSNGTRQQAWLASFFLPLILSISSLWIPSSQNLIVSKTVNQHLFLSSRVWSRNYNGKCYMFLCLSLTYRFKHFEYIQTSSGDFQGWRSSLRLCFAAYIFSIYICISKSQNTTQCPYFCSPRDWTLLWILYVSFLCSWVYISFYGIFKIDGAGMMACFSPL